MFLPEEGGIISAPVLLVAYHDAIFQSFYGFALDADVVSLKAIACE